MKIRVCIVPQALVTSPKSYKNVYKNVASNIIVALTGNAFL